MRSHLKHSFARELQGCMRRRWNDGRTQLILLEPKQSTMPHKPASADGLVRGLERAAMVPWGPAKALV